LRAVFGACFEPHPVENVIMYHLSALGFSQFFEEQLKRQTTAEVFPARIAAEHRGGYEVWSTGGASQAQLAGRLRLQPESEGLPGVGDWVALKEPPAPDHAAIIDWVFARRTVFIRGAAGRQVRAQVVAANVDHVFAVSGLDADFNVHRIERYVARILASGAQPTVILNKADVCEDAVARVLEVKGRCPGVRVLATSALHAQGLAAIRDAIGEGITAALVGSSGAGKSTLINALLGEQRMATGEVRARDGRGCHVTSHRQMVLLSGGGLLIDTPGMRELQIFDGDGLGTVFENVAALSAQCRFKNCQHDSEPGCAVKEAVASGEIEAERLEHYRKLLREAQAYELRHNERLRRQSERTWGRQLNHDAARLRHWKGRE
jgi:ribosome biogenesis GTPase